ncbi:MAG: hypothetical protein AMS18_01455 [Gemmatimonas sp. SG8_17]|nr:MAG: hypothetical protein AMS18_01455 [Gemmatimonas sp. SG8_17]
MRLLRSLTVLVVAFAPLPRPASAEEAPSLELADFAYSQSLTPARDRALQTVLIPVEVYRGALRKSLADVRVFDPDGNEVPHAIRTLAAPAARPPTSWPLPIFPLKESAGAGDEPTGDLAIYIERNARGEVIDIRSDAPTVPDDDAEGDTEPMRRTVSYILDARAVEDPITRLTVTMDAAHDYVLPVRAESSDNLEQWRAVPTKAPLVRLDFEGNRIEHDQLDLAPVKAEYLRLTWPGHDLPGSMTAVVAETQPRQERPQRISLSLLGESVRGEPGVYRFDAGGFVPADSVHLVLPETNTLVKAELASSDEEDGPWDRVLHGLIYRIVEDGQEIQQPAYTLPRRLPRFWRLEITAGQKELRAGAPVLTLSFYPDQLMFVSRDSADHQLAYGNYKASDPDFDTSDLIELARRDSDEPLPPATAKLGPQRSVAGAAALEEPPPPPPLRTYALWAILIVGALLLAVFAIRLLRQQA